MNLQDYIREDLRNAIEAGGYREEPLTLERLAHRYEVSLSPVRRAVGELVEEAFLIKKDNGRLVVNPESAGAGKAKARRGKPIVGKPREDLLSMAERKLQKELLARSLSRDDAFLREEATAARFGIGRTALRQLFNRLAGSGLIEHVPRRGWRVRRFDEADMAAYLEVREALELKALDLAQPHLERSVLKRMLKGNVPAPKKGPPRLDNDLHAYLVACSGNRFLAEFFEQPVSLYYTALFAHAAPGADVVAEMAAQHREILEALLKGKGKRARKALAEHIQAQLPNVKALMGNDPEGRVLPVV